MLIIINGSKRSENNINKYLKKLDLDWDWDLIQ